MKSALESHISTPVDHAGGKRQRKQPRKFSDYDQLPSAEVRGSATDVPETNSQPETLLEHGQADMPEAAAGAQRKVKRQKTGGKVANQSAKGTASIKGSAAPFAERSIDSALQQILDMLAANKEPYNQNGWRREPWPARPYEIISEYQVAQDAGEELDRASLKARLTIAGKRIILDEKAASIAAQEAANNFRESVAAQLDVHARTLHLDRLPAPLEVGKDIEERPAWGLDCYTYRAVAGALGTCREMQEAGQDQVEHSCNAFIKDCLLPAINRQGKKGWSMSLALIDLVRTLPDGPMAAAAKHLLWAASASEVHRRKQGHGSSNCTVISEEADLDSAFWRVHPKGQGIFALHDIPKGSFVSEYLGELYAPWRWFEKQDLLRKRNPNQTLPDFYNICLERPREVEGGHNVVFVEAADRGNFGSRLSHSCGPNCCNVSAVIGGTRITNALITTTSVAAGTELCWDYASVTESEREFKAAICLCATPSCRGSFLYYANSSTFQEIMQRRHNFLDRNSMLVRACCQPLTEADKVTLERHGIGSNLLSHSPPLWLAKWASLVLEYIELERQLLPEALAATGRYSEAATELEAEGVKENRLQNLTITLDKAAFFLRHQPQSLQQVPPLRILSEAEVLEALWTGPQSVWARATQAARKHLAASKASAAPLLPNTELHALAEEVAPESAEAAREKLLRFVGILRRCGPASAALADIVFLTAHTKLFFTPAKYINIRADLGTEKADTNEADSAGNSQEQVAAGPHGKRNGKLGTGAKQAADGKAYRPAYLWGQCVAWYKQTVFDPTASLSADRRGVLSLPDPETAYSGGGGRGGSYIGKQRESLLALLKRAPANLWPLSLPFSFRNTAKIYGSPMLDAALRAAEAGSMSENLPATDECFAALLIELSSAYKYHK